MKRFLILMMLWVSSLQLLAQNTGVNTKTPSSILSVNGSFAADYKIVTANTTLGITDNYVAYNGSAAGTITLPAAISGTGNFKGRLYCIKNTSSSLLTVAASGSELIDGATTTDAATVIVPAGFYIELISKGTTTGSTWELSVLVTTTTTAMMQPVNIRVATPQGALAISSFNVPNGTAYVTIPGSSGTFTLPAAKPVFLNLALGLDDLTTGSGFPYFRCELFLNGAATGLFQIVQETSVGNQLQVNISGVRSLPAGVPQTLDVRITRWANNGTPTATTQSFGILSMVLTATTIN